MKKSVIITIAAFALGLVVLTVGFVLLTDNNISQSIFTTTTTAPSASTTTTTGLNGGEEDPKLEPMDFFKEDMTKFVTLGQYKDLAIEVDHLEVMEEAVDLQIEITLCQAGEYTKIREGVITGGVFFSFDYTGYLTKEDGSKGEAFEGGSSTDQLAFIDETDLITITSDGTGSFIDGFAQGMLNANVGDTLSLDITFPENYHSADMAGKKTIFEVKINYIAQTNFTDGWVKEYTNGQQTTCEEYKNYIRDGFNEEIEQENIALMWKAIIDNATFVEIPEQEFNYWFDYYKSEVEYYVYYYSMFGYKVTYEEMLVMFGFENEEALRNWVTEEIVKTELVTFAIIQAEGFVATDEEYRIFLDILVEDTGKTEEELLETYGEEYIRQQLVLNDVDKKVYELNTFVLKTEK